ncbi:hypothetical protein M2H04_21645, partial [Vibrio vulnificus]|nr:hypothetical protein [Vibrio vulnificus]
GVMLNYVKLVVYGFLCSLSFSVLCLSAVGFFERCFSDINSLALEIQEIASFNFRAIARLGRLAQSEIHF